MEFNDSVEITDSNGDEILLTIEEAKELQQRLNDKFGVEYESIDESIEAFDISLPLTMLYCQIIPVTLMEDDPIDGIPYENRRTYENDKFTKSVTGLHHGDILAVIRPNESE